MFDTEILGVKVSTMLNFAAINGTFLAVTYFDYSFTTIASNMMFLYLLLKIIAAQMASNCNSDEEYEFIKRDNLPAMYESLYVKTNDFLQFLRSVVLFKSFGAFFLVLVSLVLLLGVTCVVSDFVLLWITFDIFFVFMHLDDDKSQKVHEKTADAKKMVAQYSASVYAMIPKHTDAAKKRNKTKEE
eukprot:CAMPEP_0115007320 /NCGR_PEP_ID=MMETSP0216-20121206/21098_1 /TAXON_ID=223996 /ORGANISM="Protocruzia adherens, Strain Boccale" /LENGTH=185 /DNA_ID=CAMNT_0002374217 /DNA_START=37 /DNA_END=594 /DNA_ORIENTATION=+